MNYKAHYSLSWFRPLLRDNSPMSNIFCIEVEEQCYNGVSESSKNSLSERGKCLVSPCLKGRGPFIAGRRMDNYKLFISISTMGLT
jgi:hypothetical protein